MELMAIPFPSIDRVAFSFGWLKVRWYGIAYLAGLTLGWLYMRRLVQNATLWRSTPAMTPLQTDDFLLWMTLGTVVGGRVGYFLFYEPGSFLNHPLQFFIVWEGGMAFHGGLLGVTLAIILFARINRLSILSVGDLCGAIIPFGLFFGRIANFINAEMYGKLTNVPWAVEFPVTISGFPEPVFQARHPTQLYEAFFEGILMFFLMRYLTHSRLAFKRPGLVAGSFLLAYGVARIGVEFFKEWDYTQYFTTAYFSEGMVYSLPMLAVGAYLVLHAVRAKAPALG
jgi:phosphatidylglycerol---prolipoprotein diacylglyceryl transferase